ncbi:choline transporter-like protein 2 isoform X1 [Tachypleus tridentatus]|uniref:choline transporter-like protein 2 isoform X1 n=2 Tax=Tachypleus tridentatus TaxID=6853 RepID=UPI003FD060FD
MKRLENEELSSQTALTDNRNTERTEDYGKSFEYDPEFKGPIKNRSCTDIICLLLFLAFWGGWIALAVIAFQRGDPKQLIFPTDWQGRICGVGEMSGKPYLYFFDLTKCIDLGSVLLSGCPTPQVCTSECPNRTFTSLIATDEISIKSEMICIDDSQKDKQTVRELVFSGNCAPFYLKSKPLAGRCVPDIFMSSQGDTDEELANNIIQDVNGKNISGDEMTLAKESLETMLNAREIGEKIFQDFTAGWWLMLVCLLISMVEVFLWILLMKYFAGVMVWVSLLCITGLLSFVCYYSVKKYLELSDSTASDADFTFTTNVESYLALRKTWLAIALISGIVLLILLLMVIALRTRIRIAISLIKESSRAISSMISSLFFPLIPYLLQFCLFIFWGAVAMSIASSGKAVYRNVDQHNGSSLQDSPTCDPKDFKEITTDIHCVFSAYESESNLLRAQIYNVFGLFWGIFFIIGVCQLSLAIAFATYYWTFNKPKNIPSFAVASGVGTCLRYHLGSVAFGSLLIAVLRVIRVILEYIDQKLRKYDNKVVKVLMCLCKCCFWCLENLVKFISRNAYIMIGIYGKNFCTSAKDAFFLLMRNIARVVVLDKVVDFLLFLGKLVTVGTTTIAAFYFFSGRIHFLKDYVPSLNYYLLPVITVAVGSYLIASCFFSVYSMAVDTLFLCFLDDCERNDGSAEKPYYMPRELMKILGKKNKFKDPE